MGKMARHGNPKTNFNENFSRADSREPEAGPFPFRVSWFGAPIPGFARFMRTIPKPMACH
jgi:hypothetical protein